MPNPEVQIGITDSEQDCINLMVTVIEEAGFTTASKLFPGRKLRPESYTEFLIQFNPAVLVMEMPPPYQDNWKIFQGLMATDAMQGRAVLLNTTDINWQSDFIGKPETVECLVKPFDIDIFTRVVARSYWSVTNRQKQA